MLNAKLIKIFKDKFNNNKEIKRLYSSNLNSVVLIYSLNFRMTGRSLLTHTLRITVIYYLLNNYAEIFSLLHISINALF